MAAFWSSGLAALYYLSSPASQTNGRLRFDSGHQIGNLTISGTDIPAFTDELFAITGVGTSHHTSNPTDVVFKYNE